MVRLRRRLGRLALGLALAAVTLLCALGLALLGLAELLVMVLRERQRDRLGLVPNRLLRLAQRLKEAREKTIAGMQIAGE